MDLEGTLKPEQLESFFGGRAVDVSSKDFWEHRHDDGESVLEFYDEMVEGCEICADRLEVAISTGQRCKKHPFSYFEPEDKAGRPKYCEECDLEAMNGSKGV